jgi:hypothetical protein
VIAPRAVVLLALVAGLSAGCGDDEPDARGDVRAAVERFGEATAEKDYQALCDELLAGVLVTRLQRVGLPCELALQRGLGDVRDPKIEIGEIAVQGTRALVAVTSRAAGQRPSEDAIELVREGGEWKIASLAQPEEEAGTATTTTPATTTPATTTPAP